MSCRERESMKLDINIREIIEAYAKANPHMKKVLTAIADNTGPMYSSMEWGIGAGIMYAINNHEMLMGSVDEKDPNPELYPCPYCAATKCAMDEGCSGCETFSQYVRREEARKELFDKYVIVAKDQTFLAGASDGFWKWTKTVDEARKFNSEKEAQGIVDAMSDQARVIIVKVEKGGEG